MKIHRSGHQKNVSKRRQVARANGLVLTCVSMAAAMVANGAYAQAEAAPAPAAAASDAAQAAPAPASAASEPAKATPQNLGTITVTARRRNEALVDVPIAISVVTASKMQELGIKSTTELANYTPGLEFNTFTPVNARNDRGSGRILTFRGLILTGGNAASMFLDGAAVVGNEIPASLDIGAVEVLRGPQSVYFGRATMTGAVSYRTKGIPEKWGGQAEFEVGQYGTRNEQATVAGPILPGVLGGRLTVLSEKTDGYVTNNYNNGAAKLGATSRQSVSGTLEFTPTSSLSIKGYYNRFRDDDGPAATVFVPASLDNCRYPGATQSTFCGEIPHRSNSIYYQNTTLPPAFADALMKSPLLGGAGFTPKVGQQRVADNSDLVATWDISDYLKFQSITGYHTQTTMALADGISQPVQPTFPYSGYWYSYNQKFRDFSQELRLSSDPQENLSWTVGANYIENTNFRQPIVAFLDQPAGTFRPIPQALGADSTETTGVFGGVYYKLTPKWTLSGEAREQWDKRRGTADSGTTGARLSDLTETFKSFSPRVSVDYDLGGSRKVYASYASGTRPGGFNTQVAAQQGNPAAAAQVAALIGGGVAYDEEKLKIVELGVKGELADRKGYFDVNVYMGTLSDQQISTTAFIPSLGFSVTGVNNAGESKIHGLEFQGTYNFTRQLSVSPTFAWNYTKRTKFTNTAGVAAFGTTDFSGKQFANVPEFSGSVVVNFNQPLAEKWNYFANVAAVYRGKTYVDNYNSAYIKERVQTDLRTGVANDQFTFEGYLKNVFNDQGYTGGAVAGDFGTNSFNAFFGGAASPRQLGVRFMAKF